MKLDAIGSNYLLHFGEICASQLLQFIKLLEATDSVSGRSIFELVRCIRQCLSR